MDEWEWLVKTYIMWTVYSHNDIHGLVPLEVVYGKSARNSKALDHRIGLALTIPQTILTIPQTILAISNYDSVNTCMQRWFSEHMHAKMIQWTHACKDGSMNTWMQRWFHEHMHAKMIQWTHACKDDSVNTCMLRWFNEHMNAKMVPWTHACKDGSMNTCMQRWCSEHMHTKMVQWIHACIPSDPTVAIQAMLHRWSKQFCNSDRVKIIILRHSRRQLNNTTSLRNYNIVMQLHLPMHDSA